MGHTPIPVKMLTVHFRSTLRDLQSILEQFEQVLEDHGGGMEKSEKRKLKNWKGSGTLDVNVWFAETSRSYGKFRRWLAERGLGAEIKDTKPDCSRPIREMLNLPLS